MAFGRLHGLSVLSLGVAMLAAAVVVALTVVAQHRADGRRALPQQQG